ncbi:PAS domain-containing protein [Nannocystis bainbridge]|uniref:PAS domain-containing protein n=1 Tax=Nannocystis bainbridge TaxID=2995303 RepID=A0ABT5DUD3_9BACT|nr:PAS domain-containing protein [Nannocystis bainbridge]MDC0716011.1 PAS domain-containing protein [Nannocystis bainbridge]
MDERSSRAPHVVIELDAALRVTGWNRRAEQLFGASAAEAEGKSIAELLPVAGQSTAWTAALTRDSEATEVRTIAVGGRELAFETWWQVDRDGDGPVTGVTIYGHDVTARETDARRGQLERTILANLLDTLDISGWALDSRGVFLFQDGKAMRATGLTPHQFVGASIFDVYASESGLDEVRQALAGQQHLGLQSETYGIHWMHWYIPVKDGTEVAVVGLSLDVTDTKRNEIELRAKLELIERQQEVIRELSTPIIEVWDGVITLPIVGLIDSVRTAEIMDNLLQQVARTRARFAILDLTGVEVVDTGTASHLIGMIQAIRLLGAEGILTGIHPLIAQTIVALGVDLTRVTVHAKLRDALQYCIGQLSRKRAAAQAKGV